MDIFSVLLIVTAISILGWSAWKSKEKTGQSLKVAKARFVSTAGEIVGILALVALFLAFIPETAIEAVLGGSSVALSALWGALIGTVTIIPAFVAFPLSSSLVEGGAHLVAVAAFITTLTMVGFATAPVEIEHFGKRFTLVRNILSFLVAILIAFGVTLIL